MFNRNIDKDVLPNNQETVIGNSVKVEGEFVGDGDVIVYGVVNGSLSTKRYLEIGESAKITANIEAESARIAGEVKGSVTIKTKLELLNTAKIIGDIKAAIISIEAGATINGHCNMSGDKQPISSETTEEKINAETNA